MYRYQNNGDSSVRIVVPTAESRIVYKRLQVGLWELEILKVMATDRLYSTVCVGRSRCRNINTGKRSEDSDF